MKFSKIQISKQGNFILTLLLIHFIFFGYICNVYEKHITGVQILFLYQIMFNPKSYLSAILLFIIIFIMAFRETFFEYGLRNSIWIIPFIIIMSWIWYWFINQNFDITIIARYWLYPQTYITILLLLGLNFLAGLL
ncbi:MAG: hypothetical protein ACTSPW_15770, partial [Promethearchaeota archaeon]